jgi:ABC-type transport system substrate-binding protein
MYMNDPTDIRGCIAESWEHSYDYLTWTFQIRDGVMFHDGTVCDAPAVASSWNFYNVASPASFGNLNMVSWVAKNKRELVIH